MGKHPGHEFSPQTPRSPILPSIPPLVLSIISMYKKAFDLVDHKMLLAKLEAYGIETRDLYLIRTYLTNRLQFVDVDGCKSPVLPTTHGVPQRTVLRPLFFSIFTNDLPSQIQHSVVDIYADDATLSTSFDIATGLTSIESQLQNDTNLFVKW